MIMELTLERFRERGGYEEPFHSTIVAPWLRALYHPGFEGRYLTFDGKLGRVLEVRSTRWIGEGAAQIEVTHLRLVRGELVHQWIPAHVAPPVELLELAQ